MKRVVLWLLTAMLMLSLCACGQPEVYDVYLDEGTFTVDTVNQTITFEGHVIEYELRGSANGSSVEFTYPDGSEYYWTTSGYMGHGGWSDDYDEDRYIDGDTLRDVLEEETDAAQKSHNAGEYIGIGLVSLLVIALGAFQLWAPEQAWYLSRGWMYKDVEPSDAALAMGRVGGVLAVLVGIAGLLYASFA